MIEERRISSASSMPSLSVWETYSPLRSLNHARHAHEVDPAAKSKLPMIGEPEEISTRTLLGDQMMRDRPAPAQMAEAEAVAGCRSSGRVPRSMRVTTFPRGALWRTAHATVSAFM
ncbi:MAG: hypothetical protein U1E17_15895 [Geminicoccaceae bacterium]